MALARWKLQSATEISVTDKHIRLWDQFLDSSADFLVCFEDDALFKPESADLLRLLIRELAASYSQTPCYIDLASGMPVPMLCVDNLLSDQDSRYRYYRKPVTNCACVYLMNRPLVERLHGILIKKPWLRLFTPDWLLQVLFVRLRGEAMQTHCRHACPPFFDHGSAMGHYTCLVREKFI